MMEQLTHKEMAEGLMAALGQGDLGATWECLTDVGMSRLNAEQLAALAAVFRAYSDLQTTAGLLAAKLTAAEPTDQTPPDAGRCG